MTNKILISDKEFKKIYMENTLVVSAEILKVSPGLISKHARKLQLSKKGIVDVFCSTTREYGKLIGGLPSKEKNDKETP